jgi:hypothetical protein
MRARITLSLAVAAFATAAPLPMSAQLPLSVARTSGQTVTPAFEGWYRNRDGSFSISFGYFNRNADEAVSVPIGAANHLDPGPANQGQPTEFQPGRHWGVFAVKVPADFGSKEILWTLAFRGATYAIPGNLRPNWMIDALEGEAGSGNTPPVLSFADNGPEGSGPLGITSDPVTASVGAPVTLGVWARDDGKPSTSVGSGGRSGVPMTLTWFPHQSPPGASAVRFTPPSARVDVAGGRAVTQATFGTRGDFLVRVRANDASGVTGAGHAQCCWSNGFVKVIVK